MRKLAHLYHSIVWYKYKSLRMWFVIYRTTAQPVIRTSCSTKQQYIRQKSYVLLHVCLFVLAEI